MIKMKTRKFFGHLLLYLLISLFFLIPACKDDKDKNDYSGVSELIAERNKARYEMAKKSSKKTSSSKKITTDKTNSAQPKKVTSKKEDISSIILYKEDVKVVGSKSGRILAKGVAYINKKGQIVKIKILKE